MSEPLPMAPGTRSLRLPEERGVTRVPTLLEGGFRPFFLLAGAYASASLAAWLLTFAGRWHLPPSWVPMWWHGHELVFGFAGAAIAGFLLTAVPKWTGTRAVRGAPLAGLVLLWIAGRAVMWGAGVLPSWFVAAVDLLLFPALAVAVGVPIARAGNRRNYGFPGLLLLLFGANLLTHLQVLGVADTGRIGLYVGLYVIVIMVAVVSGRIVPAFTKSALAARGEPDVRSHPGLGRAAVGAVALAALCQVVGASAVVAGTTAAVAAMLLALRSLGWRALRTWRDPILWVLHAGHAWLVVGFATLAAADLAGVMPVSTATHALTAGAIGTMVIAVMTRASLGHTGRPLRVSRPIAFAYGLVILGATLRVFGPLVERASYSTWVLAGGTLWVLGYAIFTFVYAPILSRPRLDR